MQKQPPNNLPDPIPERSEYRLPDRLENASGDVRNVGFELEFSGIGLDQTANAVAQALGASKVVCSVAEQKVAVPGLGEFVIELDWSFLKKQARTVGPDDELARSLLEPLSRAASALVPVEVVCPPVPMTRIAELDAMVQALRAAGAVGTDESVIAAYGLHINVELPDLQPRTIHDYLRAFSLLQWWLVDAHSVDLARRISPYIDLYPQAYVRQILQRDDPDMEQIMADYLYHNPSRNKALDLLPLLSEIDPLTVRRSIDDDRVNARPAFHYRLPDCQIDRADWSLASAWNIWMRVEWLAQRPQQIEALGKAFLDSERWLLGVDRTLWVQYVDQWLKDHESA